MGKWILKRLGAALMLAFSFVVGVVHPVVAISDYYLDFFALNGIYYYNPEGVDANCSTKTTGSNVTIIGDSITEGAKEKIKGLISSATIYSKVSKTFGNASDDAKSPNEEGNPSGISILKYLSASGGIRSILVYALGTNNTAPAVSQSAIDEVLSLAGSTTQVYFVTNYNANLPNTYDTNNSLFRTAAQNANVSVIDWASEASQHATYLAADGIHPTGEGAQAFAELITTAIGGKTSLAGGSNGDYKNYAGDAVLSSAQIQNLEHMIPIYEQAIKETGAYQKGVTWEFLAAMHYKETGLAYTHNPASNDQGLWQLYTYVEVEKKGKFPAGAALTDDDVLSQTKIALENSIIPHAAAVDLNTDDGIKEFFFKYNGTAQKYKDKAIAMGFTEAQAKVGEGSPYVMNRYDAQRDPVKSEGMSDKWPGMYVADGVWSDTATSQTFGAYVVYAAIGGATACVDGMVSGGLDESQALGLMKDYMYNVTCTDWTDNCSYIDDGKANCVTFVQYFISRFTSAGKIGATGNGGWVVSNLTGSDVVSSLGTYRHTYDYSSRGFTFGGFEPRVYAIFSTGLGSTDCGDVKCGHTGVVLGIDRENDVIYIGQAAYGRHLAGYSDVVKKKLSNYTNGHYWFAYTDNIIDYDKIGEAVAAGRGL